MRLCVIFILSVFFSVLSGYAGPIIPGSIEDPHAFQTSWHPMELESRWTHLPLSGSVPNSRIPWADSYWPRQRGGFSYRWQEGQADGFGGPLPGPWERRRLFFGHHRFSRWELLSLSSEERQRVVKQLSPLEKFSIFKGDYRYRLLSRFSNPRDWGAASWQGFCHAWAPVALHYSEPAPVSVVNRDGIRIDFGSSDVKAIMMASYADRVRASFSRFLGVIRRRIRGQSPDAVFIGQRCRLRFIYPETHFEAGREVFNEYGDPAGVKDQDYRPVLERFKERALRLGYVPAEGLLPSSRNFIEGTLKNLNDPACEDVNPGTFHLILSNMIGLRQEGFLIDKTRDLEVWNQPAFRYESVVLGQEGVRRLRIKTRLFYADDTDQGWAFWNSTLSPLFGNGGPFLQEYQRYQEHLLHQGRIEVPGQYPEGILDHTDYEYTLDLDSAGQIIGGEWISFERPDFLWLFRKSAFTGEFSELNSLYRPLQIPDVELRFPLFLQGH